MHFSEGKRPYQIVAVFGGLFIGSNLRPIYGTKTQPDLWARNASRFMVQKLSPTFGLETQADLWYQNSARVMGSKLKPIFRTK